MVRLPGSVLRRYPRFSLYNSPYAAHDTGSAVDLYPDRSDSLAPSPVAGTVVETRRVRAPPKPYAPEHDHLIVVDVDEAATGLEPTGEAGDYLARVLHVEPEVEPGDEVAVGDRLGTLVRAGFFAPWVATHLHVGFRPRDADVMRASGSLRLDLGVGVEPVAWDGTGTVVAVAETYAILDAPDHPAPGERFAGVATDEGVVLDGGLPHYDGGGALDAADGSLSLLGTRIGRVQGRDVSWSDVAVLANGRPVTGLSLFCGRDDLYAKLVCPDRTFAVGDAVSVSVEPRGD